MTLVCFTELPAEFMANIKLILNDHPSAPSSTSFSFEMNDKAATQNSKIIAEHNYDLTKFIDAFSNSHMAYGSEFRNHAILDKLLHKSPHWPDVKRSLSKGTRYPLERINNRRRHQDLQDAVKGGNHKSAKTNLPKLIEIVDGEVQWGF